MGKIVKSHRSDILRLIRELNGLLQLRETAEGLLYLHEQGVVHADLHGASTTIVKTPGPDQAGVLGIKGVGEG